jgi:hypothetical protein
MNRAFEISMLKNIFQRIAVVGFAVFALTASSAMAETISSTPAIVSSDKSDCKLQTALDALLRVKDSDFLPGDRAKAELSARKDVISQIAACSVIELDNFKKRLNDLGLKNNDEKDRLLKEKFLGDVDAAKFYFNKVNDGLSDKAELEAVKELAKNIALWRESFYVPALLKINDFLLILENAQAIKTAQNRFDKITFSLSAVKLDEVIEIKDLLDKSSAHIKRGAELNRQAHDLIWNVDLIFNNASSSPSSTASAVATTTLEEPVALESTSTAEVASTTDALPKILPLVKDSLMELRKAYAAYLSISGIVKKYLGL